MFYSSREVIIMMNTITLLSAAWNIFRGWHRDALPKKENIEAEHVKRVIQVCVMIAVIVDNVLADVLANS